MMPRPCRKRMISEAPPVTFFKPSGVPLLNLRVVRLTLDEWEALRLADAEKLYQEEAARRMDISRPTFSRLIESARGKVAGALTSGAALEIEGGPVTRASKQCRKKQACATRRIREQAVNSRRWTMSKRIAITAQSEDLATQIDPRFGRAAGFLVYDMETGESSFLSNEQNLNAVQGAGVQAARHIVNEQVDALITGNIGPKAFRFLDAADVKVYLAENVSIQEALALYKKGELSLQGDANVAGHW
ncbi:MAG: DUF134 domain-containing protein [Spartobacteria bacterium]|nr:DUF134 domain-containing protein [Spartobacteria bacterium]